MSNLAFNKRTAPEEESSVDIKKILRLCKKRWYIILLSLVLALGAAYAYIRYTVPVYETTLRLLIKDGNSTGQYSEAQVLTELGLRPAAKNYENEIMILRSVPLIMQIVEKLNLQYRYWIKGRVRITDIYQESPIEATTWDPYTADFPGFVIEVVDRGENRYVLNTAERVFHGEYGKPLSLPHGKLVLSRIPSRNPYIDRPVYVEIKSVDAVARDLSSRINVSLSNRYATILHISLIDPVPQRAEDVLNELALVYSDLEIRERNRIYENTLDFIDERLQILAVDLKERDAERPDEPDYGHIIDLSSENASIQAGIVQNNNELTEMEIQLEILDALEEKLSGKDFEFIPTNITMTNSPLNSMINRLNELQIEREKLASTLGPNHPNLQMLEKQLKNMRANILENIAVLRNDMRIRRNAIESRRQRLHEQRQSVLRIPGRQPEITDVQLQQQIKESIYLFLLRKKEETALKLAATVSSSVVVEDAYSDKSIVRPNAFVVYRNAAALGLAVPLALLIFIGIVSDKIETVEDIRKNTRVPIAGTIMQGKKKLRVAVREKSRSAVAESFRLLRTNLHFVSPDTKNQIFLLTSVIPGEGKSFICLNLAITMALAGKKTLIIELDLRKPKLSEYFGLNGAAPAGLSQYLSNNGTGVEDIIRHLDQIHPDLYFMSSGPVPPDPGELILSTRLKRMMDVVSRDFDVILIDSAPVGVVADTYLLNEMVDTTVFIVRQHVTREGHLKLIEDILQAGKLPRPRIIFNGVKNGKNGFGYGYAGKHGYYHEDR